MGGCCVPDCTNNERDSYRFFRLPARRLFYRRIWLKNARLEENKIPKRALFCQVHFAEEMFQVVDAAGHKQLKTNAIPTLFGRSISKSMATRTKLENHNSSQSVECPSPVKTLLHITEDYQPKKMNVAHRKVKIGENKYHCYLLNEAQTYPSSESSDNETAVEQDLNIKIVDDSMEIAYENSSNAEKRGEEMKNDVIRSLKCQLCRMCGRKRSALIPIFGIRPVNEVPISEKIELHLPLKVKVNDGLPPNICLSCNSMLQAWHDLHVSSLAADAVLRRMFQGASENMLVGSEESCEDRSNECEVTYEHCTQPEENCKDQAPSEMLVDTEDECDDKIMSFEEEIKSSTDNFPLFKYQVKCRYCSGDFDKDQLKEHKEKCQLELSICEICGICIQLRHLKTHISRVHEKTLLCENCGILFSSQDLRSHKGECTRKPTACCEFCCRVFFSEQGYKTHLEEHERGEGLTLRIKIKTSTQGDMPATYICPVCSEDFQDKLSVVAHLNALKLVTCEPCNVEFRNERAYLVHVCMPGKKMWHCRYCFQTFKRKYSWLIHERTHCVEDRTFHCRICKKQYPSLESVMQHSLSHGPGTYYCVYCDEKFNSQSLLKEHILRHGGYVYECNECSKLFQTTRNLKIHYVNAHKKKAPHNEK